MQPLPVGWGDFSGYLHLDPFGSSLSSWLIPATPGVRILRQNKATGSLGGREEWDPQSQRLLTMPALSPPLSPPPPSFQSLLDRGDPEPVV